ncbi:MAG: AAA family ATPase, partial [Caldithrix sp.]|nr:AAA family ATPase [Caldithrix sp.]
MENRTVQEIPQYTFGKKIIEGMFWDLYRGKEAGSESPVLIKHSKPEFSAQTNQARFRNEYEILKSKSILKTYGLQEKNQFLIHIIQDVQGESLAELIKQEKFTTERFLKLAIHFAETLHHIHHQKVIIKNLRPSTVLADIKTHTITVIDFSRATLLKVHRSDTSDTFFAADILAYASPEQTGRMNRHIDYRTDFYSLGVIFYEMLVGWQPFQTNDPLEMIHAHIAKKANPPHKLNLDIPPALSAIVMKLMAKNAEERYQSALGLRTDLEYCLQSYRKTKTVPLFPLGKQEILDQFQIPQKLYGREKPINQMLHRFDQVCSGANHLVLIKGTSGIGKSVLVNEIQKPVLKQHGFFISGKFEEFSRDTPYSSLLQALRELVRQLLSENAAKLAVWKERIIHALGSNARLIVDVVPELEWIIGKPKQVRHLPAHEAKNRFNFVFSNFVKIFCRKESPLVLFLDDLQWADSASFSLLRQFLLDPSLKYFMVIAAFRDQKIDAKNPLHHFLQGLRDEKSTIETVTITALAITDITEMLMDTFHCDKPTAQPLAGVVHKKTLGNPFFIKYFLQSLYQKNLLYFKYPSQNNVTGDQTTGGWQWNIKEIEKLGYTENVINWFISSLQSVPSQIVEVLKIAACIGLEFNSKLLSRMTHLSHAAVEEALWKAVQQGLILEQNRSYNADHHKQWNVSYKFVHNRIHEALQSLMDTEKRKQLHLKIGQILLKESNNKPGEALFSIVNQLNAGYQYIYDDTGKLELIRLNFDAGSKARDASAYKSAQVYYNMCTRLLPQQAWTTEYNLSRDIYFETSEIEFINGHYEQAEHDLNLLLKNVQTNYDKARVQAIRVRMYVHQSRLDDSLAAGIKGLRYLNIKFSANPGKWLVLINLIKIGLKLSTRSQEKLYDMRDMRKQESRLALNIITDLLTFAYNTSTELFMILLLTMLKLTLKHGNADASSFAYGGYGVIVGSGFGFYRKGHQFGKLQLLISEKFPDSYFRGRAYFGYACLIEHWVKPLAESQPNYEKALEYSLQNGDFLYAANTINNIIWYDMVRGLELDRLYEKGQEYLDFMEQIRYDDLRLTPEFARQYVNNLQGKSDNLVNPDDGSFPRSAFVEEMSQTRFTQVRASYHILRAQLFYIFNEPLSAAAELNEVDHELHSVIGHITQPEYHFYQALNQCRLIKHHTDQPRWRIIKKAQKHADQLKKWTKINRTNFSHKYALAQAEIYRVEDNPFKAMPFYDEAIREATDNGFVQNAAIAKELTARFYLEQNQKQVALTFLVDAIHTYRKWGASAKIGQLESEMNQVFDTGLWSLFLSA